MGTDSQLPRVLLERLQALVDTALAVVPLVKCRDDHITFPSALFGVKSSELAQQTSCHRLHVPGFVRPAVRENLLLASRFSLRSCGTIRILTMHVTGRELPAISSTPHTSTLRSTRYIVRWLTAG